MSYNLAENKPDILIFCNCEIRWFMTADFEPAACNAVSIGLSATITETLFGLYPWITRLNVHIIVAQ